MRCVDILSAFRVPVQFHLLSEMSSILPAKISFVKINPAEHQMFVGIYTSSMECKLECRLLSYFQEKSNYFGFVGAFLLNVLEIIFHFALLLNELGLCSVMNHFECIISSEGFRDTFSCTVDSRIIICEWYEDEWWSEFCLPELWKFP